MLSGQLARVPDPIELKPLTRPLGLCCIVLIRHSSSEQRELEAGCSLCYLLHAYLLDRMQLMLSAACLSARSSVDNHSNGAGEN